MSNETTTAAEPELLADPEQANMVRREESRQDDRAPRAVRGTVVREGGSDVVRIERAIVKTSGDDLGDLYGALSDAQAEDGYGDIERTRTARVEGKTSGVRYTYDYETLADVIAATRPFLAKHKLATMQFPFTGTATVTIKTRIGHASGQWIEGDLVASTVSLAPQDVGSAITYLRRYALKAMLNVSANDDDDDGGSASGVGRQEPPRPAPRKSEQQAPADPRVGTVVEGPAENGGAWYVKLSTGFRCATRDMEMVKALEAHRLSGNIIELTCRAPSSPKYAPTLEEITIRRGQA